MCEGMYDDIDCIADEGQSYHHGKPLEQLFLGFRDVILVREFGIIARRVRRRQRLAPRTGERFAVSIGFGDYSDTPNREGNEEEGKQEKWISVMHVTKEPLGTMIGGHIPAWGSERRGRRSRHHLRSRYTARVHPLLQTGREKEEGRGKKGKRESTEEKQEALRHEREQVVCSQVVPVAVWARSEDWVNPAYGRVCGGGTEWYVRCTL
jgi:hypothetical protein